MMDLERQEVTRQQSLYFGESRKVKDKMGNSGTLSGVTPDITMMMLTAVSTWHLGNKRFLTNSKQES